MAQISIKTIAEKLNLSPGTISIVLNGRGDEMRIAKKTQERVLEEARNMGYKPNIHARRLRQTSTVNSTAVGVLWPSLYSSEVLVRFFEGMQRTILDDDMNVEVVYKPYHYSEVHKISSVFKNSIFNGVIVVGASDNDVDYIKNVSSTMPIVFFNRQTGKHSSVCVNDYSAGYKVADLFYSRGHKEVGLVESNSLSRNHSLRSRGFIDGCQRHGINLRPANIQKDYPTHEGGMRCVQKLVKSGTMPTAILFALGSMVTGAYPVFSEYGIRIPEDVELIGYGDNAISHLLKPSLSVLDLPVEIIVKKCIHLILEMIDMSVQEPVTFFEDTNFIFRESCGGFPKGKVATL